MQPRRSPKRDAAMTLFEVGVVLAIVALLVAFLLPMLVRSRRQAAYFGCVNNLKQVGLAFRIWEGDNNDIYPMGVSLTNSGSLEMVITGKVVPTFQLMSNELGSTKILVCPMDLSRTNASSFAALTNNNLSYFVGVDVTNDLNPLMILAGDANFAFGGVPVKSGLLHLTANSPVAWTPTRHGWSGNLCFADGSAQQVTNRSLPKMLGSTGAGTNRFAIP